MSENKQQFLPNFCDVKMVISILVIGELFAIILTLSLVDFGQQTWDKLAIYSIYIHWNSLLGMLLLCVLRRYISSYHPYIIAALSYIGLLMLILMISESSYTLITYLQLESIFPVSNRLNFHSYNLIIGSIIIGIALRYFYVLHQWKIQLQAKADANFLLLQARIRPHFLFNSMNTIASLTRSNAKLAEEVTINLASLFRVLFQQQKDLVSWSKELQIARQYLQIESLRLAHRLKVTWSVEQIPDNALLPILTLQPLLENAIYFAIEPSVKGGSIEVSGNKQENQIVLKVTNSINQENERSRTGNQMAIENIRQRLAIYFGNKANLELQKRDDAFCVTLLFPYLNTHETINRR